VTRSIATLGLGEEMESHGVLKAEFIYATQSAYADLHWISADNQSTTIGDRPAMGQKGLGRSDCTGYTVVTNRMIGGA